MKSVCFELAFFSLICLRSYLFCDQVYSTDGLLVNFALYAMPLRINTDCSFTARLQFNVHYACGSIIVK